MPCRSCGVATGWKRSTKKTPNPCPARRRIFSRGWRRSWASACSVVRSWKKLVWRRCTTPPLSLHRDGELTAVYRKVHLFDVKAPDREYLESASIAAGDEVVTAKAGSAVLGLSVCYDVRFPELYRLLALRGAEILAVPAAFTLQTGKDHWEVLLRARAIENQAFVVAPAQWGQKADGRWTYGRSMILDPWGTVLSQCPDRDGYALATLDLDYLDRFRTEFPALANRRPQAYDW